VTGRISEFMQNAGIDASLHSLRHLHASMTPSRRVPIPIVSKRLGHANRQVTLDIYARAMRNDETTAALLWDEATAEIIDRTKKPPGKGKLRKKLRLSLVIPVKRRKPQTIDFVSLVWSGREDSNLRPPGAEPTTDVLTRCPV
jgi:hypothetical protein